MPLAIEIQSRVTYRQCLEWNDGERWELIDGQTWNMTPGPGFKHQRLAGAMRK